MKRIIALSVAAIVIITGTALFFGCDKKDDVTVTTTTQMAALSGKISLSGSTSVKPVIAALAEAFMQINTGVEIDIQEGGSSVGVKDAMEKKVDIGMSSRELKDTETGLSETVIAFDGIAVIVHSDVNVTNLTKQQLKDIFTGTIKNWSEVGGTNGAIVVIGRDAASGTRGAFEELLKIDGKDPNPKASYAQEKDSTGAVKATVQSTKNSIGYISLEALDATVKSVSVDGIAASVETVKAKTYLLFRPFLLVNNEAVTLNDAGKAFISFILSDDGQKIITDNKLISAK